MGITEIKLHPVLLSPGLSPESGRDRIGFLLEQFRWRGEHPGLTLFRSSSWHSLKQLSDKPELRATTTIGDSDGLTLNVTVAGGKAWLFRYYWRAKLKTRANIFSRRRPLGVSASFASQAIAPASLDRSQEVEAYINEQLEGRPVPVVGWSLRGCLALALCRRAPAMVESMILISTAARFGDDIFGKTIELNTELQAHADYLDILLEPRQGIVESGPGRRWAR